MVDICHKYWQGKKEENDKNGSQFSNLLVDMRSMILMAVDINILVLWDVMCNFVDMCPSIKVHAVIS
jgi:hypothetical protein